jgi:hypothetical protein
MIQTVRGLAIAYPCERLIDGSWQIVGINRRYLDAKQVKEMIEKAKTEEEKKKIRRDNPKTKLAYGGNWGVYRLRRIKGAKVLLVIEGEENSQSVWQAARANGWSCDVTSVGSQGNFKSLRDDITTLASDYQHLLIWADEQHIADEAIGFYGHPSVLAVSSPALAGYDKPADANAMLTEGDLLAFLAHQLTRLSADLVTVNTPTNAISDALPDALPSGLSIAGNESANEVTMPTIPDIDMATNKIASNPADDTPTNDTNPEEMALWAKYARELEDDDLEPDVGVPRVSAWWAFFPAQNELTHEVQATNDTAPNPAVIATTDDAALREQVCDMTASDELLELIVELCSQASESSHWLGIDEDAMRGALREQAESWYLTAERHYMYGDITSLFECYEAIQGIKVSKNFQISRQNPTPKKRRVTQAAAQPRFS